MCYQSELAMRMIKSVASVCLLNDDIDDSDQLIKKSWSFLVAFLKNLSVFSLGLRTFAFNYFKKIKLGTVHHPPPEGEGAGGFLLGPDKIKINRIPLKGSLYSLFFFFFLVRHLNYSVELLKDDWFFHQLCGHRDVT